MRDWLNAILAFIGSTSLTDDEYDSINFVDVTNGVYDQASYDALAGVLETREAVSTMQERLVGVFTAKGADIEEIEQASSNIYIGDAL